MIIQWSLDLATIAVFVSAGVASLRRPLRITITRLVCSAVSFLDNFSPISSKSSAVISSNEDDVSSDDDDFSFEEHDNDEEEEEKDEEDRLSSEDDDVILLLSTSPMMSWMIFFHSVNVKVEFPLLIAKYKNSICPKRYGLVNKNNYYLWWHWKLLTPQSNFSAKVLFLFILLNTFVMIPIFSSSAFGSNRNDELIRSIAASSSCANGIHDVRPLLDIIAPMESFFRNLVFICWIC